MQATIYNMSLQYKLKIIVDNIVHYYLISYLCPIQNQ